MPIQSQIILEQIPDTEILSYMRGKGIESPVPKKPGVMNVDETLEYLGGISRMSLWRLCKTGKIVTTPVGSRTMYLPQDLDSFLRRSRSRKRKL